MSLAVDSMWLVEQSKSTTVEDVKEQERIYAKLHQDLVGRYGRYLDLVTANRFVMVDRVPRRRVRARRDF